jgi:hypothetical protein
MTRLGSAGRGKGTQVALGLEYGRFAHGGGNVGARPVIHVVLGCMVFGAAVVKVIAVRAKRAPGWLLPVAGRLLLTCSSS